MPRRRTPRIAQLQLNPTLGAELSEYVALPSFASSPEEIRLAVEQNALDRGVLLTRVMGSLQIGKIWKDVRDLASSYDMEDYHQHADDAMIDPKALEYLSAPERRIPYPYYFCLPEMLIARPDLIFYYRNVALLSAKVMRGIGLDTQNYEERHYPPDRGTAQDLARYFNRIISTLVIQGGADPDRHFQMMMANLGDSLGGVSRNEVGRIAMCRIIDPLMRDLFRQGRLKVISFKLKGRIYAEEEEEDTSGPQRRLVTPDTDIEDLLQWFAENRVIYRELETSNGSHLLLNRQLNWRAPSGESYPIGPDVHTLVGLVEMSWAGELKGGADPAGSDEHWKTATQAFERIRIAAEKTNRPNPKLSFIATILVERVAQDAQRWLNEGRLYSVYNLTQMYQQEAEMRRYLDDMAMFLGYD